LDSTQNVGDSGMEVSLWSPGAKGEKDPEDGGLLRNKNGLK